MPRKVFTEKEKKEIIYQYSVKKIGAKTLGNQYGCSAPTLLKNLKEWGIQPNQKKLDLTGQKFGELTATQPTPSQNDKYTRWICQCNCGNTVEVRTDYLTSKHTLSCGCLKNQYFQPTIKLNVLYGKLTPIRYEASKGKYLCKCECGNEIYVQGCNLTTSNTQSCGCLKSKGELKINNILMGMNIHFKTQYSFPDCRFPNTNRLAYFDYAIFNNDNNLIAILEYDGIQHEIGWKGQLDSLNEIRIRDNFKDQYCLNHNIPLIRISYRNYIELNQKYFEDLLEPIL